MADHTDFLDLYRKLRLDADCTLAEFKQAYRRHVSQWHPDRRRGTKADALAARRLQRLTAQYGAAMEFHKRHGRLPGATVVRMRPAYEIETRDVPSIPRPVQREAAPEPRSIDTRWILVAGAVGIAAFAWSMLPAPGNPDKAEARPGVVQAATVTAEATGSLTSGMNADEVIAVEGEPTRRGEDHWEYGPSWIRFDGGAVTDWYSSPLRPLHARASRAHP